MDHEEVSYVTAVLLDYVDRKGPRSDEDKNICRQLLPFVVQETGVPSVADLASRSARRRDVEEALLGLEARGGSAGWLLGQLAAGARRPVSRSSAAAMGGIWQQNEGNGNMNLLVGESVHGLNIGFPPQSYPGGVSDRPQGPVRESREPEPVDPPGREDLPPQGQAEPLLRPDLEIRVLEGFVEGRPSLTFEVTARDSYWRLERKTFGPVVLRKDPEAFLRPHLAALGKMAGGEECEAEMRSLGADLGRQLLESCGLLALLWSLQHRVTTVLLVSDEPWIPWELIRLEDPTNGKSGTGRFLCEAFAFARWLPGSTPTLTLPLRRIALVAAEAGAPAGLQEEKEFLEKQQSAARSVCSVPARLEPLLHALASGGYDGWHFCGHGGHSISDPNQASLVLDDYQTLTPGVLRSEAAGLGRGHPLVFLNGCHTGRAGFGLTALGGWASQLVASEAGAFLGALWAIYGYRAAAFAQAFYPRLFAGVPIAQAVRDARQASRSAGDPSWLAYSLYAHPLASCSGMNG